MRRIAALIVGGLMTATVSASVAVYVEGQTYEDGSGRIAGVSYCLPWALCQRG